MAKRSTLLWACAASLVAGVGIGTAVGLRHDARPDAFALEGAVDCGSGGRAEDVVMGALARRGEGVRRTQVRLTSDGSTATLDGVEEGQPDDSVDSERTAYRLQRASDGTWRIEACRRHVLACQSGRGSPPVCD